MKNNKIRQELVSLGIINDKKVVDFYPKVRDRDDVSVLKCEETGVIFLSGTDHIEQSYYSEKSGTSYWSSSNRSEGLKETYEDDKRRFDQFGNTVKDKVVMDVGCGLGGVLDLFKTVAKDVYGLEPQADTRKILNEIGYKTYDDIFKLPADLKVDVITLFHVFEHIVEPLRSLKSLHAALKPGGKIIIEVPHASDALIKSYNLESFKAFTFWSEHLILHTGKSIKTFLEKAGFKNISVTGYQRYPLSNHLYWLKEGKPGGQKIFTQFNDQELLKAYANTLDKIDETDTIIAVAEK